MTDNPIDDRRQRAREAFYDHPQDSVSESLEVAIGVAAQVKITHDVVMAFINAPDGVDDDIAGPLIAAFRAAGFEVIE